MPLPLYLKKFKPLRDIFHSELKMKESCNLLNLFTLKNHCFLKNMHSGLGNIIKVAKANNMNILLFQGTVVLVINLYLNA